MKSRYMPVFFKDESPFIFKKTIQTENKHRWHFHSEFEICWFKQGKGVYYIGDRVEWCSPGDLFLIGPKLLHTWLINPKEKNNNSLEFFAIQFNQELMNSAFFNISEFALDIHTIIVHTTDIDGHPNRRYYVEKYYP